jgi:predicted DsbA family dithiol-disulfide isomerase
MDPVAALRLTLFSDPICPWCWIGKRRIEKVVQGLGVPVQWTLKAYELGPREAKPEPVMKMLRKKYGGTEAEIQRMFDRVRQIGAEEGLIYDFERAIAAPSFDAHRLIKWAAPQGKDRRLLEELHLAHFRKGMDISEHEALEQVCVSAGLEGAEAARVLKSGEYAEQVKGEIEEAHASGVRGVPFLILNDEFAVSGAQPMGVFQRAVNQALGN